MATLAERVKWIKANRRRSTGDPWTYKALSLAAGLSQSHVGQIARGTLTDVTAGTLLALAHAAGVSSLWLIEGRGSPDDSDGYEPSPSAPEDDGLERREPMMGNLAHWNVLVASARVLDPTLPAWTFDVLRRAHPLLRAPLSAQMIVEMARLALKYETPPEGRGTR